MKFIFGAASILATASVVRAQVCNKRLGLAYSAIQSAKSSSSLSGINKFFTDKGMDINDITSTSKVTDICSYNPSADPNQGCWALYEKGEFPTSSEYFSGDESVKAVYEAIDEYCECVNAYERDCIQKVPYLEPNMPFFPSQVLMGSDTNPANYLDFCVFAGLLNGDANSGSVSSKAKECGCLWIDMVEEYVDDCPGVELGDFDTSADDCSSIKTKDQCEATGCKFKSGKKTCTVIPVSNTCKFQTKRGCKKDKNCQYNKTTKACLDVKCKKLSKNRCKKAKKVCRVTSKKCKYATSKKNKRGRN